MKLKRVFKFDSAHFLPPPYKGKCSKLHGHTYKVVYVISGKVDEETGMLIDFSSLKTIEKEVLDILDHTNLNEIIKNPTVENISAFIFNIIYVELETWSLSLKHVEVYETENSSAICDYRDNIKIISIFKFKPRTMIVSEEPAY